MEFVVVVVSKDGKQSEHKFAAGMTAAKILASPKIKAAEGCLEGIEGDVEGVAFAESVIPPKGRYKLIQHEDEDTSCEASVSDAAGSRECKTEAPNDAAEAEVSSQGNSNASADVDDGDDKVVVEGADEVKGDSEADNEVEVEIEAAKEDDAQKSSVVVGTDDTADSAGPAESAEPAEPLVEDEAVADSSEAENNKEEETHADDAGPKSEENSVAAPTNETSEEESFRQEEKSHEKKEEHDTETMDLDTKGGDTCKAQQDGEDTAEENPTSEVPSKEQQNKEDDDASTDTDNDAENLEPKLLQGWFFKKPESRGKQKRRYFVLGRSSRNEGFELQYYQKLKGSEPKGAKGAIAITSETESIEGEGVELRIKNPKRTWVLKADDPEQAKEWRGKLAALLSPKEDDSPKQQEEVSEKKVGDAEPKPAVAELEEAVDSSEAQTETAPDSSNDTAEIEGYDDAKLPEKIEFEGGEGIAGAGKAPPIATNLPKPKSVKERTKNWDQSSPKDKEPKQKPKLAKKKSWLTSSKSEEDRTIRTVGKVGGFTETALPLSSEAQKAIKSKKSSGDYVSLKISDDHQTIELDTSGTCGSSANSIQGVIMTTEPRYLVIGGKKRVFIYSCPDESTRQLRMLYATAKNNVPSALKKLGISVGIKMEISDLEDITDDALKGKQPSHKAPPPKDAVASATKKPLVKQPSQDKNSLGAFMIGQLGGSNSKLKKKVVMPPSGAYC